MKKTFFAFLIFVFVIFFAGCNDPVFYQVSQAIKLRDPFISGSPTNFVVFQNVMYVASGKSMYKYEKNDDGNAEWKRWGEPFNDRIVSLAVTDKYLYVLLIGNSASGKIRRYTFDTNNIVTGREDISLSGDVQSIYAAGDILFICTREYNDSNKTNSSYYYSIHYLKDGSTSANLFSMEDITATDFRAMLKGAAFDGSDYYYLCTDKNGIFYTDLSDDSLTPVSDSPTSFTGIIKLNDDDNTIVAISRGGTLYKITTDEITSIASFRNSSHRSNNGALAIWKDADGKSLLLAGRQENLVYSTTAGYTYGYLELQLDETTGGIKEGATFAEPGTREPSSILSNKGYVSSLGKNPVNHIIQAPYEIDEEMILFASTQLNGVWSYRERNGKMEWNAED